MEEKKKEQFGWWLMGEKPEYIFKSTNQLCLEGV